MLRFGHVTSSIPLLRFLILNSSLVHEVFFCLFVSFVFVGFFVCLFFVFSPHIEIISSTNLIILLEDEIFADFFNTFLSLPVSILRIKLKVSATAE